MAKHTSALAKDALENAAYYVEDKRQEYRLWRCAITLAGVVLFWNGLEKSCLRRHAVEADAANVAKEAAEIARRAKFERRWSTKPQKRSRLSNSAHPGDSDNALTESESGPQSANAVQCGNDVDPKPGSFLIGKQAACSPILAHSSCHVIIIAAEEPEQLAAHSTFHAWFANAPFGSKKQCQQSSSSCRSTIKSIATAAMHRISTWVGF